MQPKTVENQDVVDTKLVIIEHPKTSHILYKTIRQTEKISFPNIVKQKNVKIF